MQAVVIMCMIDMVYIFAAALGGLWLWSDVSRPEKQLLGLTGLFTFVGACCMTSHHQYYRISMFVFLVFGLAALIRLLANYRQRANGSRLVKRFFAVLTISCIVIYLAAHLLIRNMGILSEESVRKMEVNTLSMLYICIISCVISNISLKKTLNFCLSFAVILAASSGLGYVTGNNSYMLHYAKDDMPQYSFAQKINSRENSVMLCYKMMDAGFYNIADQIPEFKYFYRPNINDSDMFAEMKSYVESGEADFVISAGEIEDAVDISHYRLTDEMKFRSETSIINYCLYEKVR